MASNVDLADNVQDLLNDQVINTNETPIKTSERPNKYGGLEAAEKTTFNAYIRTYSNKTTTVLTANSNKTEESVVMDNICIIAKPDRRFRAVSVVGKVFWIIAKFVVPGAIG